MTRYITKSAKQTKSLAAQIAQTAKSNIFALTGDLGAGKTTFIQGFAEGLGIKEKITSPTFVLIRQHQIPNTTKLLYHIDLYRLDNVEDFKRMGLKEILSDKNNIVLIEWAERLKELPKTAVKISIERIKDNKRSIIIE